MPPTKIKNAADPTADVEGHDVQAKIALLAKLAFGQDVALDKVPCAGISNLSSADFACAKVKPTLLYLPWGVSFRVWLCAGCWVSRLIHA